MYIVAQVEIILLRGFVVLDVGTAVESANAYASAPKKMIFPPDRGKKNPDEHGSTAVLWQNER